ncbi:MAG: hypothetical protein KF873_07820 [Gemmataceae bacterium]|nr:hypothetical protein [Planctomycetia bacterium]MBX3398630.1 hypothetical protein [Gemmataceae bacterium]
MRTLLVSTCLLLSAGGAAACLNDATLEGSEREFRSQYQTTPPLVEPPAPYDDGSTNRIAIGGVLAVAAVALTLRRSARS